MWRRSVLHDSVCSTCFCPKILIFYLRTVYRCGEGCRHFVFWPSLHQPGHDHYISAQTSGRNGCLVTAKTKSRAETDDLLWVVFFFSSSSSSFFALLSQSKASVPICLRFIHPLHTFILRLSLNQVWILLFKSEYHFPCTFMKINKSTGLSSPTYSPMLLSLPAPDTELCGRLSDSAPWIFKYQSVYDELWICQSFGFGFIIGLERAKQENNK